MLSSCEELLTDLEEQENNNNEQVVNNSCNKNWLRKYKGKNDLTGLTGMLGSANCSSSSNRLTFIFDANTYQEIKITKNGNVIQGSSKTYQKDGSGNITLWISITLMIPINNLKPE